MKKFQLKVNWKTNEFYDVDQINIVLNDDQINAIKILQAFVNCNPVVDSLKVKLEQNQITTDTDSRIGVGFVKVTAGSLIFTGQDNFDSSNQVETEELVKIIEQDIDKQWQEYNVPVTNVWSEIRNDFEVGDIVYIDAWLTADDNEAGTVIAKINVRTKEVEYLDDRARTDSYAQQMINEK